jgi:hypothetical protein
MEYYSNGYTLLQSNVAAWKIDEHFITGGQLPRLITGGFEMIRVP